MKIANPLHSLTLGGLVLMENGDARTHDRFTTEVSADGVTWGNPEIVVTQIISALSEGDLVTQSHVGNREVSFRVRISGVWAGDLAEGEKALAAVVGQPAELVWQPPDDVDPPTVFDILHSRMDFEFDDLDELRRTRTYVLTMTALPRGRSATKVVTAAVTAFAPTVVDSGSSTTGWSAPSPTGAVLSVSSGAVTNTYDAGMELGSGSGLSAGALQRVANFDVSTQPYVAIDWSSSRASAPLMSMTVDGQTILLPELRREPAGLFFRSWYAVPGGSTTVSKIVFTVRHGVSAPGTFITLKIDQVQKANALPPLGTGRQLTNTVNPGGSIAAEGDVLVQHATAGLGQAIVYSYPSGSGYSPSMRQWVTSTGSNPVSADSTTVSGSRNSLITQPTRFDIPVTALPPDDPDMQLWARLRMVGGGPSTITMFYAIRALVNGVELDLDEKRVRVSLPTDGSWAIVPLAQVVVPPRNLGMGGLVRVQLLRDAVLNLELDEAWLFAMGKGRLTVVDCGAGTPSAGTVHNRLRVTAPSLVAPNGRIDVGTAADWSDAFTPSDTKVACDQKGHRFDPNGSSIFTVTSGTPSASVSLEHYPRWHTHAGVA